MNTTVLDALRQRRSVYDLGKSSPLSDSELQQLIQDIVKQSPSAFNSQSQRVVMLLNKEHDKLWDIVKNTLKQMIPSDRFAATEAKINSFQNGYGTILFFEEMETVRNLQKQFSSYKDNFPVWSQQSNGMLQIAVWSSLAENNIGASIQHYNPLIDEEVKKTWNLPESYQLVAQMPFGTILKPAGEKEFMPIGERMKTLQ